MRFLTALIVIFSLAGVLASALALREHYNTEPSACSINEHWDCGAVNHSPYAVISGVPKIGELPVALIGIMGYAVLAAVAGRSRMLTLVLALIAFAFALRLSYIEWRVLMTWCIYCVSSQVIISIVLLLALVSVIAGRGTAAEPA
ncbi:MAG: vitamin K epoxide reductase [Acidobacteria bacterium]|nr:vitamin K epoxide reductase [Acidobacteriota bacterium]